MTGRSRDYHTIGEVVESLGDKYPDLTVSKIRFLEEEGLIRPERTPGGYRKFKEHDLARIELVVKMQREHFLPLAVIKERLAEMDAGRVPEELRDAPVEAATLPLDEAKTVRVSEMPGETGLPVAFVEELARFGLIRPVGEGNEKALTGSDVDVAGKAWELRRYGIEPRHLKMFDQFAEREAQLLARVLSPAARLRTPEARQRVVRRLEELASLTGDIKSHALRRALADTFDDVG